MWTAPQKIFVTHDGVRTPAGGLSFDEFSKKICDSVEGLVNNPKAGPFVLGAIQNPKTCDRIADTEKLPGKVWLKSRALDHPMFPNARIATPVVVEMDSSKKDLFSRELDRKSTRLNSSN